MKSTHFLKETFASSLAALLGLFLLPLLLLPGDAEAAAQPADAPLPAAAAPASAEEPSSPPTPAVRTDEQRTLRVLHRGTVTEMTLHDYLVGVVAGGDARRL